MHPNYQNNRIKHRMESKNKLFSLIEPSENLKNSIINIIRYEERKKAIYKIVFSSVVSLASISLAIFYAISIVKDFYQSGLSDYISLIFTDGTSLISYWQSYFMSILESLPILQITIVFASMWALVWSLNVFLPALKNTKKVFYKF